MTLPLEGVRVLAVEQYGAGPFGTQFLADQGAEVIKIENPNDGGDFARRIGPFFFTPEDSEFFHAYNRNKKSLTLDLSREEGFKIFAGFCSNLRCGSFKLAWGCSGKARIDLRKPRSGQ